MVRWSQAGHLVARAVAEIERELLALDGKDRADVLRTLIGHLDDPLDHDVESMWPDEAERCLGEIDAGTAKTPPAEEAFREVRAQPAGLCRPVSRARPCGIAGSVMNHCRFHAIALRERP